MKKTHVLLALFILLLIGVGIFVVVFIQDKPPSFRENAFYYLDIDEGSLNPATKSLFEEAKEKLSKDPEDAEALRDLGTVYNVLEDYEKSKNLYQQALEKDPKDIITLQNLADVYNKEKQYKKAEETHYHILESTPLWMGSYESLGELYRFDLVPKNDKFPKTIEQARKIDVDDQYESPLVRFLGFYYYYKGENNKARLYLKKFMELNPENSGVKKILDEIGG